MTFSPALLLIPLAVGLYHRFKPLPPGLACRGPWRSAADPQLLTDLTFVDRTGRQGRHQEIFTAILAAIGGARRLVVLDFFLYNDFTGQMTEQGLPLAEELTSALLTRKKQCPTMTIIVITDPINTVYGSVASAYFARLRGAGITVAMTRLDRLRDSNPLYSCWWWLLARPLTNGPGRLLANPFGPGRISLGSFLRLLNFKANHRKVLIADQGETLIGLVGSANPHDASSSHSNVALRFAGPAAHDLLASEAAVLAFSGHKVPEFTPPPAPAPTAAGNDCRIRILTESAIRAAALEAIAGTGPGDRIDLLMFYLSHRRLLQALRQAHRRGARLRVLLDPNKDAFGRLKQGMPNRQVGYELHRLGIAVRWAATHGEQCHAKLLLIRRTNGTSSLLLGSANFTRRNLDDLNLETDVEMQGPGHATVFNDASHLFDSLWENTPDRLHSVEFTAFADPSRTRRLLYRLLEATGLCTF